MKKIFFLLIPILFTIFIVEFTLFIIKPNYIELDKNLGWKLKSNFKYNYSKKNLNGEKYLVKFSTNHFGMRNFQTNLKGDSEINFFILGDSYTSDPYAGNDKMWYSEIAKNIFNETGKQTSAYSLGAGGYGNLQQLLSLKEIKQNGFDFEKIDFFIFQFCTNDFINNSLTIEKKLKYYNQYSRRPYLFQDQIIFDNSIISKILRNPFFGESRILNKFFFLLSKINTTNKIEINYSESIELTKIIISNIKKELNNKFTIFLNCNDDAKWTKTLKLIAEENNFIFLQVPSSIKANKKNIYEDGAHLSENGNVYLGNYIYKTIVNKNLFSFLFDS